MAAVMMKAIAHVTNPVNDLDNDHMDPHVQVDVDMDRVKPQPHLEIQAVLILMDRNLMKEDGLHVVMIIAPRRQLLDQVAIKVEILVNQDNPLVTKDVHHVNQANLLDIKVEHHVNQVNLLDIKVATLAKMENHLVMKEKDQAIKAEITPLKSVILNLFFRKHFCNLNTI
jgi:hypothetical protein